MKLAAIIQAYHRPDLLAALVERLDTPLWNVYVHIDAKSDLSAFEAVGGNARFLETRIPVNWGGYSQVDATLMMMRAALSEPHNTHVYLMSGQCYPIKTDAEIAATIERQSSGGNFIATVKMPVHHKPYSRLSRRWFKDLRPPLLARGVQKLCSVLPDRDAEALVRGVALWGGSTWWMLSRDAATRILAFVDANPWFTRAFAHTLSPDEMMFQTLVKHLDIPLDGECPTKTKWIEGRANPEPITTEIYAELSRDWHFCLRKFTQPGGSFVG